MTGCRRTFLAIIGLLAFVSPAGAAAPAPVLQLPVTVHLVQDMTLERHGVTMAGWITVQDIERAVVPEVNRIWRAAGISWNVMAIDEMVIGNSIEKRDLERLIMNFEREPSESTPGLGRAARAFAKRAGAAGESFHLFVVPYVGRTLQGFAVPAARIAFLGAWTDKPSKGVDPPRPVKLSEREPLLIGSIGRTAAHELGHLLGLKHNTCTTRCLMGGTKSDGYELTAGQIETARATAAAFLDKHRMAN